MVQAMAGKRQVKRRKRVEPRRTEAADPKSKQDPAQNDSITAIDLRARLRTDIVSCELAPGQRLKFEELRARYDVGIGSLRETLMQLEADGLVIAESNRGFCVAPVTIADL